MCVCVCVCASDWDGGWDCVYMYVWLCVESGPGGGVNVLGDRYFKCVRKYARVAIQVSYLSIIVLIHNI